MDAKRLLTALIIVAGTPVLLLRLGQSSSKAVEGANPQITGQSLKEPAGASRCQFCHASEVEGYAQSAMAQSLRRTGQEPNGTVETRDGTITMRSSPTGYWQRLESGGDSTNYRIDYVIGSGKHASGYLLDLAGHFFQSPVAYYERRRAYDLAPGYEEVPHPDFTRPVTEACLFCHSGKALKVEGTSNEYRSPAFSAEAISCERCHGSAEKHLQNPTVGTIINPAKLESVARDSVCEQCHLLGVGRVLNPGKQFFDFHPGERLEDVFTTYVNVLPPGAGAEKFKVISHVEQLARSACSRKSSGKLWCGTCHDPHNMPADPVSFFRAKCLSCHTAGFSDSHPDKESNCIGCHMPRRDARDGGHTAFTDHRIQRRPEPDQDLPSDVGIEAWREPSSELQKRNLGIAYINAGMERRSREFIGHGYRLLTEVQQQFSGDSEIFTSMGSALLVAKQASEAEFAFDRALELNPNSATAETNAASAYLQAGDIQKAVAHLEHAVSIDPLHLEASGPLIDLYKQQGKPQQAEELSGRLSAALEKQPVDTAAGKPTLGVAKQNSRAVFKNVQVLSEIPSDQLIPTMRFFSASLGVDCNYCHVQDHFDRDDKKPKQTARAMIRMMATIDNKSFAGNREVTCYTCHRGSPRPESTPEVGSVPPVRSAAEGAMAGSLPTADELIDRYIQAVGGSGAIEKISSRVESGKARVRGQTVRAEAFYQDPNRKALVMHLAKGDSIEVFDGNLGWSILPGGPLRDVHADALDEVRMDADLHFPLHIRQMFADLRVEYPEKINDREALVISCANVGKPLTKLYFDEQSGLLLRLVWYAESPLGLIPTQIDYSDYRDVGGVKTPFLRTMAQPGGRTTIQWERILQNVPIDGARFAKPKSQRAQNNLLGQ